MTGPSPDLHEGKGWNLFKLAHALPLFDSLEDHIVLLGILGWRVVLIKIFLVTSAPATGSPFQWLSKVTKRPKYKLVR